MKMKKIISKKKLPTLNSHQKDFELINQKRSHYYIYKNIDYFYKIIKKNKKCKNLEDRIKFWNTLKSRIKFFKLGLSCNSKAEIFLQSSYNLKKNQYGKL